MVPFSIHFFHAPPNLDWTNFALQVRGTCGRRYSRAENDDDTMDDADERDDLLPVLEWTSSSSGHHHQPANRPHFHTIVVQHQHQQQQNQPTANGTAQTSTIRIMQNGRIAAFL